MGAQTYPTELVPATWDKKKGTIARVKPTGIGEALKALQKLHASVDWSAFDANGVDTLAELEAKAKAVETETARHLKPLLTQVKAVDVLATRWAADFTKDKLIPKSAAQAASGVAKAAKDLASEINDTSTTAQAELLTLQTKLAAAQKKAEAKADEDDDADENADDTALGKKLATVLKALRSRDEKLPPLQFMACLAHGEARLFIAKAVGGTHKKLLTRLLGGGTVKTQEGLCIWEKGCATFVCESVPAGLAKLLAASLLKLTTTKHKVRVRGLAPDSAVEGAGEDDEDGDKPPRRPGVDAPDAKALEAALAALALRLKNVQAELERLRAFASPIGAELQQRVDAIAQGLQARQVDGVDKLLDQLEQMARAVAAKQGGGAEAAQAAQAAQRAAALKAELAALAERLATQRAELDRLRAFDTPAGPGLRERIAAIEQALQARQPDGLAKLLDQLAQVAKAVAAQRGGGAAAAAAAAAAIKEKELAAELAALAVRLKALQDELARLKAYDTPIGGDLRTRVDTVVHALQARTPAGVAKQLDELAQIAKAVAQKSQGGAAAAVKGAEITQEKALQQRAKDLGLEVDAALAELRRVTQTIKDPALRKPVAQALDRPFADKLAAQKLATPAEQIKGLQAVLDGVPAVKKLADDALLEEAAKLAYETAFGLVKLAVDGATAALAKTPDAFTAKQRDDFEGPDKKRTDAATSRKWADAQATLAALAPAAAAVNKASAEFAEFGKAMAPLEANMKLIGAFMANPAAELEPEIIAFSLKGQAMEQAVATKDWVAGKAAVPAVVTALKTLTDAVTAFKEYQAALALVDVAYKKAGKLRDDEAATFAAPLLKALADAEQGVAAQTKLNAWRPAALAVPAIGVASQALLKAKADHTAYLLLYTTKLQGESSSLISYFRACGAPKAELDGLTKAEETRKAAADGLDWAAARAAMVPFNVAMQTARAVRVAGTAYYNAFRLIGTTYNKALAALRSDEDRLALPKKQYTDALLRMRKAAGVPDWVKALAAVAAVETTALALIADHEAFTLESEPFELEYAKLTKLETARKVSNGAPATFKPPALNTFRQAYLKVNDARNAGDFATATAGLAALSDAIDKLLEAHQAVEDQRQAFEEALAKVADLDTARGLVSSGDPALATDAAQLKAADLAIDQARTAAKWDEALAAVPALDTAVKAVLKARADANKAVTPEGAKDLEDRIKALKPRTDKAVKGTQPVFVEALKKTVVQGLATVKQAVAAKDYVAAEVALAALRVDLDAMDKGQDDYDEHLARFEAARTGDVATALAAKPKLAPAALHKLRADAIGNGAKRIQALAGQGKLARADALIVEWVAEAKAWGKSAATFATMSAPGGPDRAKLEALAQELGGGKVLDALVAQLPDDVPQKVLKEALSVRYGFTVEQFEKKNPKDVTDLTGLTKVSETEADKSLKEMYQVLGKVPLANVKGKINELIRFQENAGGAAYGGKKVYMYCGRADDPKASQQKFGQAGEVVPDGEEVDDSCKPVDNNPLPYFNFAAMHEVGHAVDDAKKYMNRASFKGYAGWQKHTADEVAAVVAGHFGFDVDYVKATLAHKKSKAPAIAPPTDPTQVAAWEAQRKKVDAWCQSVRVGNSLWNQAGLSKMHAINGRVYHEAYEGDWVSYLFSARAQGITGYQFRAPGEWFAELYAAYFSKKLKKSHPATAWLKTLKTIA